MIVAGYSIETPEEAEQRIERLKAEMDEIVRPIRDKISELEGFVEGYRSVIN